MDEDYLPIIIERIKNKIENSEIKNLTFRDVGKEIIFAYLEWIESK